MPDVPEEAITAAAVAIHDADCPDTHCSGAALGHAYRLANAALTAAGPVIRAQEAAAGRERIRQQLDDIATGFEHSHKPATEKCTHAEGIRYAISCLSPAEPEPVAVMCGLPGCRPGEHPYDPAVCGARRTKLISARLRGPVPSGWPTLADRHSMPVTDSGWRKP